MVRETQVWHVVVTDRRARSRARRCSATVVVATFGDEQVEEPVGEGIRNVGGVRERAESRRSRAQN